MIGLNSTVSDEKFVEFAEKIATASQQAPEVSPMTDVLDLFQLKLSKVNFFGRKVFIYLLCSTNKKTKRELLDKVDCGTVIK